MSVSQTLELNVIGTKVVRKSVVGTAGTKISQSFTVADSVTDEEHDLDLDVSEIKSVYIVSTAAVTIEWNDASGTQGSIVLVADEPVLWWSTQKTQGGSTVNPLGTTDITTTFWTNASGGAAVVNIEIVIDEAT